VNASGDPPIRILVADDQALLRGAFRMLIDSCADLTTIGEAGTGRAAVELARRDHPDLVLMDVRMPDLDGIEATRLICGAPDTAQVRVVILTTYDLDEYVYAALRAGASGFLLKDTAPADLLTALHVVAAGDALLAPTVTRRLITEFTADRNRPSSPPPSWPASPTANAKCSPSSVAASTTTRSPTTCTSAWPPPAPTSATC
jgi:DNA-binding NarL/FixJ family response regulator